MLRQSLGLNRSRANALQRKFSVPPPQMARENEVTTLQPTDAFKRAKAREYYEKIFKAVANADSPWEGFAFNANTANPAEQRQAFLNAIAVQLNALMNGDVNSKIDQAFINDFQMWLRGLSCHNADPKKTPWGTKPLVGDDIIMYQRQFVEKKIEFEKALAKLKIGPPEGLMQAWLYYKYIVCGVDPEGDEYLPEYDWLTNPAKMDEIARRTNVRIAPPKNVRGPALPVERTGPLNAGAMYPIPQDIKKLDQFGMCDALDARGEYTIEAIKEKETEEEEEDEDEAVSNANPNPIPTDNRSKAAATALPVDGGSNRNDDDNNPPMTPALAALQKRLRAKTPSEWTDEDVEEGVDLLGGFVREHGLKPGSDPYNTYEEFQNLRNQRRRERHNREEIQEINEAEENLGDNPSEEDTLVAHEAREAVLARQQEALREEEARALAAREERARGQAYIHAVAERQREKEAAAAAAAQKNSEPEEEVVVPPPVVPVPIEPPTPASAVVKQHPPPAPEAVAFSKLPQSIQRVATTATRTAIKYMSDANDMKNAGATDAVEDQLFRMQDFYEQLRTTPGISEKTRHDFEQAILKLDTYIDEKFGRRRREQEIGTQPAVWVRQSEEVIPQPPAPAAPKVASPSPPLSPAREPRTPEYARNPSPPPPPPAPKAKTLSAAPSRERISALNERERLKESIKKQKARVDKMQSLTGTVTNEDWMHEIQVLKRMNENMENVEKSLQSVLPPAAIGPPPQPPAPKSKAMVSREQRAAAAKKKPPAAAAAASALPPMESLPPLEAFPRSAVIALAEAAARHAGTTLAAVKQEHGDAAAKWAAHRRLEDLPANDWMVIPGQIVKENRVLEAMESHHNQYTGHDRDRQKEYIQFLDTEMKRLMAAEKNFPEKVKEVLAAKRKARKEAEKKAANDKRSAAKKAERAANKQARVNAYLPTVKKE